MTLKTLALAAAVLASGAMASQAATVTLGPQNGHRAVVSSAVTGAGSDIGFTWTAAPATAFQVFTIDKAFELFLTAYTSLSATATTLQTSGWVLKAWNGSGWDNLTRSVSDCSGARWDVQGRCDRVASEAYNGTAAASRPGEQLSASGVTTFGAGRYLLGLYDSGAPFQGAANFRVAAVPLPASGLALIAGLGGLAAIGARRRRNAA